MSPGAALIGRGVRVSDGTAAFVDQRLITAWLSLAKGIPPAEHGSTRRFECREEVSLDALEQLSANLSQGWDVVYIVAHGAFVRGRAMLYLEDEEGNADVVSGVQLAAAIARRLNMPRLVVLASCQSAGSGTSGAMGVTQRDPQFPRRQLQKHLALEMRKRYPGELANLNGDLPLNALIQQVARARRAADPAEPFRVLAGLPLKMYITTTPDNLLADALTEVGRKPAVDLFHWRNDDELERPPSVFKERPDYRPTQAEPLVYHLFGRLAERDYGTSGSCSRAS